MILFLDFDGVLHSFPMRPTDKPFAASASLWKILDDNPDISVVITTTWREKYSFPELLDLLGENGGKKYLQRFLGVTPVLESTSDYMPGVRLREIEAWLADNASGDVPYVILDDIEEYFDSNCKNLYLVDGATGLADHDIDSISLWLRHRS